MAFNRDGSGAPRFSVGTVLSGSLSIVFGDFFRFLAIIVLILVPVLAVVIIGGMLLATNVSSSEGGLRFTLGPGQVVLPLLAVLLLICAFFLTQAAIVHGAMNRLRGQPVAIFAAIAHGVSVLPRVFVAGLLFVLAIGLITGLPVWMMMQSIAPGAGQMPSQVILVLIVAAAFVLLFAVIILCWVFVPVIVVERTGPIAGFARSIELTRDHRWAIAALVLILLAANWAASLVSVGIKQIGAPVAGGIVDLAVAAFFTALTSVMATVGYSHLRAEKEGVPIDDIVKVFD